MLKLFNTLSLKFEPFIPFERSSVKMYTCGPSTYQRPHIGNYRTFLFEDVLQRYLEYSGFKVSRLITLTDIEDKAIAQAEKEKTPVDELTQQNEKLFFRDFNLLRIKTPDYSTRASTVVNKASELIKKLQKTGYAYKYHYNGEDNYYFNTSKFEGFGKLAKLDLSKWPKKRRRFHLDTYPGTPWNRGDFVLWHGCKKSNVCWNSEIGKGRPAWNIQDAAIVTTKLGFVIDVACGGIDNLVRHHDYTIAVAEAVSGKPLAKYWLHGAHLLVDGKKMSKSKGNVFYPDDFLKDYSPEQLRFFLIYSHYRKKLNFTFDRLQRTSQKLDKLKEIVRDLAKVEKGNSNIKARNLAESIISTFEENMNNDLDVKKAIDEIQRTLRKLQNLQKKGQVSKEIAELTIANLQKVDRVLQVIF